MREFTIAFLLKCRDFCQQWEVLKIHILYLTGFGDDVSYVYSPSGLYPGKLNVVFVN